ncbi:MAG: DUF6077 domain-containing protein [Lachnospiraceae bacterium]|nr:DUF6077 domain-containing protein [Lachnospiraceae bacterium]
MILFVYLGIVPIALGPLFTSNIKRNVVGSLIFNYFVGIMVEVALMQLISVPLTLTKCSFSLLVIVYSAVISVLLVLAALFRYRVIRNIFGDAARRIRKASKCWILVLIGIYVPILVLSFQNLYIYGDDKTYITMITDILNSNTLYLRDVDTGIPVGWILSKYSLSSYFTWLAYMAKITGLHPLILCKTALMYIIIPMGYAVQGLLSAYLFRNNERKMLVYMLCVILVTIMGGFSNYTVTYRFYTWVWQSKAFLAIVVLPFLFYYCNLVYEDKAGKREYLILFIAILATCATTLTGTGLAVGMVLFLAGMYSIRNKNVWNLISAVVACCPAYVLMVIYLQYDRFLSLIGF